MGERLGKYSFKIPRLRVWCYRQVKTQACKYLVQYFSRQDFSIPIFPLKHIAICINCTWQHVVSYITQTIFFVGAYTV